MLRPGGRIGISDVVAEDRLAADERAERGQLRRLHRRRPLARRVRGGPRSGRASRTSASRSPTRSRTGCTARSSRRRSRSSPSGAGGCPSCNQPAARAEPLRPSSLGDWDVRMCRGAIMVDAETSGALGQVGIALAFGLAIMTMIYAVGHVSGAHFNPAVTVAFALTRHFPWPRAAAYVVTQLAAAIAAAAAPPRLSRRRRRDRAHGACGLRRAVLPLRARAHVLPDVRDHGRCDRHEGRRRGRRSRDRRHRCARGARRRADLRRLDESRPLVRPSGRRGRAWLALDLPRRPCCWAPRSAPSPTS